MGNKKVKLNQDSFMEVTWIVDKWVDQDGREHRKIAKNVLTSELNLGSLNNPSEECKRLVSVRCVIPSKDKGNNLFSGLTDLFK